MTGYGFNEPIYNVCIMQCGGESRRVRGNVILPGTTVNVVLLVCTAMNYSVRGSVTNLNGLNSSCIYTI